MCPAWYAWPAQDHLANVMLALSTSRAVAAHVYAAARQRQTRRQLAPRVSLAGYWVQSPTATCQYRRSITLCLLAPMQLVVQRDQGRLSAMLAATRCTYNAVTVSGLVVTAAVTDRDRTVVRAWLAC